ncbi:helix-turn-helix transcriptional regulator [Citrobacter cronae]|uniref:helix-turn-helix transcriptional regulator n=1 Tax=Citrobacter cronae TaxID=1748967 RepID=UPI0021D16FD5|nr:AraC family transcriptional regulator [Citrobacter cronae]MCU6173009.1 AraC family transcriptional regulator [Citrobacter cronae]
MSNAISRYILYWIEDNLYSGATVTDLVKNSGYSRRTLENVFRRDYGESPGDYLFRRRISRAAATLKLTRLTITEIAMLFHYNSAANFTRAFRRYFGCTPDFFRRDSMWNKSKLQLPILYQSADFIGEKTEFPAAVFISGERFMYQAIYTDINDCSFAENIKKRTNSLLNELAGEVWVATHIQIPNNISICRKGLVNVDAVVGVRDCSDTNATIIMPAAIYEKFNFSGLWEEYVVFSRLIYSRNFIGENFRCFEVPCFIKIHSLNIEKKHISCSLYILVE